MFWPAHVLASSVLVFSIVTDVGGDGSFVLTHAPSYLKYNPNAGSISLTDIPNYLTSIYGFSLHKELSWHGIEETSLFQRPQAAVLLTIEGINMPLNVKTTASFPISKDDSELNLESTVNQLHRATGSQDSLLVDFSEDNHIFDIQASYPSLFDNICSNLEQVRQLYKGGQGRVPLSEFGTLDLSKQNDLHFISELHVMLEMGDAVLNEGGRLSSSAPDLFHFRLTGLRALVDEYGRDSKKVTDAMKLLNNNIDKITEAFKKIYAGNVLVHVVTFTTSTGVKLRVARSLMQAATPPPVAPTAASTIDIRLTGDYPNEYGVIFNLYLWTTFVIVCIIIAICVAFFNMDPGRDSIIYRMTTQRLKKD